MSDALHTWVTRFLLAISMISVIFISNSVMRCYRALIVEHFLDEYAHTLKSGYVEELDILLTECGKFGYDDTKISITRIDPTTRRQTFIDDETVASKALGIEKRFELEQWDFVRITSSNGTSVLQATWTYRADERAYD